MRESVFEAYLEDGEELLWEGYYYRDAVSIRDFDSLRRFGERFHIRRLPKILLTAVGGGSLAMVFTLDSLLGPFLVVFYVFALTHSWHEDRTALLEILLYERGEATNGLSYAVTNRRLLAYDFASKRVFRELRISSTMTAFPAGRGVSIDPSRSTAWVWPLDRTSADEATKAIREVRDRMKAEAA